MAHNFAVEYFDIIDTKWTGQPVVRAIEQGFEKIVIFDVVDYALEKRLKEAVASSTNPCQLEIIETPNFYLTREDISEFFGDKKQH